jgi:hypothetical protein
VENAENNLEEIKVKTWRQKETLEKNEHHREEGQISLRTLEPRSRSVDVASK